MVQKVIGWQDGHKYTAENVQGPERTYARTYIANLRDIDVDPFYIFQFKKCPRLGSKHPVDKAAHATRVRLTQISQSKLWDVYVEWSTAFDDASNEPDPLKRPAEITITTTLKDVPTYLDGKGLPLINTAGDLLVGTTSKPFQNIRVQKNVAKIPDWFHELPGAVNKLPVRIDGKKYDKRELKLLQTEKPKRLLENKKWFYPLVYNLLRDKDTHDTFEPSRGYHELIPKTVTDKQGKKRKTFIRKRILIGNGEYPKTKQYLDKNGRHVEVQPDRKGNIDLKKIYILRTNRFREENLNVLPRK